MDSHKTKAEKARHVPLAVVMVFLGQAKEAGWSDDFILDQLRLVDEGVRDVRLHDETCKLLLPWPRSESQLDDMRWEAVRRWGLLE